MPEGVLVGFMSKLSCDGRRWHQRWFVLHGPSLSYFRNPSDSFAAKCINMVNAKVEVPEANSEHHDRKNEFQIRTDQRVFSIVAPDIESLFE
jgi:hypothetical protein